MIQIELRYNELNGKKIGYHTATDFLIQVGKNKSGYRTLYLVTGNLAQAVTLYNGVNVGYGFKKRLIAPSLNKPLLARQFSE